MSIRLYNTLTRTVEPFEPRRPGEVTLYVCGPTVYDEPHLGHMRSAYVFDVLRRHLARTLTVRFVRNVTDVDDKIIEKAKQELGLAPSPQPPAPSTLQAKCAEVATRYLARYHEALALLGIQTPGVEPKATEHVVSDGQDFSSMVDLIAKLVATGAAYEVKGGSVYFAVRKFPVYGALSNRTMDELQTGARVEPGEEKQDPIDFALWKAAKPGEPSWPSPWGQGRPGWHIECSAMSMKYLGDAFDIHGGGLDLIFPHHENEIAQAQAVGKPFAKYWVHHGLVTVNGEKMSKSLGNFITVEQALAQCQGEVDILKTFFLGTHYRSPLDYSDQHLHAAAQRFDAFDSLFLRVQAERLERDLTREQAALPPVEEVEQLKAEFDRAMDNDLNTPRALAALDQLTNHANQWMDRQRPLRREEMRERDTLPAKVMQAVKAVKDKGEILGLSFESFAPTDEQMKRVQEREQARKRKDFQTADRIRKGLETQGVVIEDTPDGPLVRRKR